MREKKNYQKLVQTPKSTDCFRYNFNKFSSYPMYIDDWETIYFIILICDIRIESWYVFGWEEIWVESVNNIMGNDYLSIAINLKVLSII